MCKKRRAKYNLSEFDATSTRDKLVMQVKGAQGRDTKAKGDRTTGYGKKIKAY